jgi:type I site-specific restriction-modification system R (restriction) subunit
LAGLVNGLPLVVIELKKPGVPARAVFDENLTHYILRTNRHLTLRPSCI